MDKKTVERIVRGEMMDPGKSGMELLYEDYLSSDDLVIDINGSAYYKIIKKEFMEISRRPMSLIVIPSKCIVDRKCLQFCDENQICFKVGAPAHMSFGGRAIPVWYRETLTVPVYGVELDDIGMYVRQVQESDA